MFRQPLLSPAYASALGAIALSAFLFLPSPASAKAQPHPVGDISIVSRPAGLPFFLRGPSGTRRGTTPLRLTDLPIGRYTVHYKLPSPCPPVAPFTRALEAGGSIDFVLESVCAALNAEEPEAGIEEEGKTPAPVLEPQRQPVVRQHPLRVTLTAGSTEATPGGSARFTVGILNRGFQTLRSLTVDYRYDGTLLAVSETKDAELATNQARWAISELPPGRKWETTFTGVFAQDLEGGTTVSSTVTALGRDLAGLSAAERSATANVALLTELPKTGRRTAWDLLVFAIVVLGSAGVTGAAVVNCRNKAYNEICYGKQAGTTGNSDERIVLPPDPYRERWGRRIRH